MSSLQMLLAGGASRVNANYVISSNRDTLIMSPAQVSGYVAGRTDLTITVNSGVYLYSVLTSQPALSITGFSAGDTIRIVNNGFILGKGADAPMTSLNVNSPGNNGGPAISLSFPVTIDNTNPNAYIAGGGGSGASIGYGNTTGGGGGGAGGGMGGGIVNPYKAPTSGGGPGSEGASDPVSIQQSHRRCGGGGGRILPGVGGATAVGTPQNGLVTYGRGGGAGGSGVYAVSGFDGNPFAVATGGGGGWGAAGGAGYYYYGYQSPSYVPQYGGGGSANQPAVATNTSRPYLYFGANGGLGGNSIVLNGNSVTWVAGDTTRVWGNIS